MPQVGAKGAALYERLFYGHDGSAYRVVKVDGDGNLVAALKADQEIEVQSYGWIGAAWQKNPLAFGYSDTVFRVWSDTSLDADTNYVSDTAVPAGEIRVLTNLVTQYTGTVPTNMRFIVIRDATDYYLFGPKSPVSGQMYDRQGFWVLEEDDVLSVRVAGATATDALHAYASGFRVDIDQ